nr:immunoglobulin heavy chain junction region [Macaca mulatta]MOW98591.1 immunoglobulin heavy chain junction region [Macaca mulatta]MOW99124.1 immunoglobulin heavy chain junction region [Macaca mulatta]MOW99168.1 immunoglobulin heavy chain junction region [Macaca mulatta]MOW99782.1 immunoglobulin heavy chain junction region [Macaca mulatta]
CVRDFYGGGFDHW